jgi:transmembrane sensor
MFGMGRKARITRAADTWVVRTSRGLSNEELSEREMWRAADPDHERAWQKHQRIWGVTEGIAPLEDSAPNPVGIRHGFVFACMAGILAAGGGAFLLHRELQHGNASTEWAASQGVRHILLPDGSSADLAPGSAIRTDFSGSVRAVLLERGSARFDVAHDVDHPFVVSAADRKVTAIGTRFQVALQPTGVVVTLFQGAVEVAEQAPQPGHAPVRMSKGQRLTISNGEENLAPVADGSAGNGGAQDVDPTAVGAIVDMANRSAAIPIRFADPGLAAQKVEGRFPIDDTQALAQQLAAALDLVVAQHDGAYWLSSR